jgi:hypothetical protein
MPTKNQILLTVLIFTVLGCANKQNYSGGTTTYPANSSIPAYQYDQSYKNGCNKAVFTEKDGTSYNGGFCYGKKRGSGIEIYKTPPSKYEGEFNNDYRMGFGVYTWFDSKNTFRGNFKDGRQHGVGTFTFGSDGSSYVGNWVMGKLDGEKRIYSSNGLLLKTEIWSNGILVSPKDRSPNTSVTSTAYSDTNSKMQKCKRLGLVVGTDDYNLCINSLTK